MIETIYLNGRLQSDLNWQEARKQALDAISADNQIIWDLDLGLFKDLTSIHNETQFLSLSLSLDHFRDTLWDEFHEATDGVILYHGDICFENEIPDNGDRFFARDAIAEYLSMLVGRLPDALTAYVHIDATALPSLKEQALLLTKERFRHISLVIKGNLLPAPHPEAQIAICLPPAEKHDAAQSLHKGFDYLSEQNDPYRIIPEESLVQEWGNLDYLLVDPDGVSSEGYRKLQGFCAAGGTVINLGDDPLGLPYEQLLSSWKVAT